MMKMATTGEQAYRERYKRTNEQARGDMRVEGAGGAGSCMSGGAEGRGAEDRRNDASQQRDLRPPTPPVTPDTQDAKQRKKTVENTAIDAILQLRKEDVNPATWGLIQIALTRVQEQMIQYETEIATLKKRILGQEEQGNASKQTGYRS